MAETDPQGGQDIKGQIEAAFQNFLGKFQKPEDGAMKLYTENYDLRQKNTTLKSENEDLKKKVPAEGMAVISKEDNELLETVKSLKLKSDDIKNLSTENASLKRDKTLQEVAQAGYSLDAVRDFDSLEKDLEYVVKDETKDGKTVKSVLVKVDGKERPFEEYAKEKRPALAQVLRVEGAGGQTWVKQDAGGKATATNIYDQIRKDAEANKKTAASDTSPLAKKRGVSVIGA